MHRDMKRAAIAAVVSCVVLVVWGMMFWGFIAPKMGVFHALPDAGPVTKALSATSTPTGT